ncbi:MAG: hypothetical protein JW904_15780 [Spirochaetales bacterium]|nr:hypothetical protein [Spirochaetales bacterium]
MKKRIDQKLKTKVLICIGDAAGGHISAANALQKTFAALYPETVEVKVVDVYAEANIPPFNNSADVYMMVNKSRIGEIFYNTVLWLFNTPVIYPMYRWYLIKKMKEPTRKIVDAFGPDIVVSNNSVVTPIFEQLKKEGAVWKSVVLVTDIAFIFRGWGDRHADMVISPTEESTAALLQYRVDPLRICSHLFPINPALADYLPRDKVLKKLGLSVEGKKTVLVTSGGFGVLALGKVLEKLAERPDLQVIVLAGRVEEFRKELDQRFGDNPRVAVLGFVDNIQDYYNAADIIVGKPGPATIIEIELFRKKAVLTKSIGFQEKGNVDFALKNPNFRSIGGKWQLLPRYIDELLSQDAAAIFDRRRFDESEDIVRHIANLAGL